MTAIFLPISRAVLRCALWLVHPAEREAWHADWQGPLLHWMLTEARSGRADARRALLAHSAGALRAALASRFKGESALEARKRITGRPQFSLGAIALILGILALSTRGFVTMRQLAKDVPYPEPERVVLLAQGPPTLGVRLGFLESEARVLRRSATLESVATYSWYSLRLPPELGGRTITAAGVSPEFFQVLEVGPEVGKGFEPLAWNDDAGPFLVSHEFFAQQLKADPSALGRHFDIGGATLRLAGVLPPGFSFLNARIPIWMLRTTEVEPSRNAWWLGLKGTIGRLRRGIAPEAAERDLRQLLVDAGIGRAGSKVHATPIRSALYRALGTYGSLFLAIGGCILTWAAFRAIRDRRRGYSWQSAVRFHGFFLAKTALLIAAIFVFVFEMTGVNRLGLTGGIWWGRELYAMWASVCGVAMTIVWALRDQRRRCRQCLHRMRQPIRIGVRGQMLLDPAGEEVICPNGHGSVYTSESVLGSEMSEQWMGQ